MNCYQRISEICKSAPGFEELYNARVRHYTIKKHTINVYNQFEIYFSSNFNEIDIDKFRLILLIHDIGKSIAHNNGNKGNQYTTTISIILENKLNLSISEDEFLLIKALISNDFLGLYMQNKISLDDAFENIVCIAKESNLNLFSYFYLLSVYYQCDVASYTEDAGGLKYLEYLFEYDNGIKVYNKESRLLNFSSKYNIRYLNLRNKIFGSHISNDIENNLDPKHLKFIKGNIFNSNAQTIVNTVNCVGVMGKGIALVFKLRYPLMFDIYKIYCSKKYIGIGKLWLYREQENAPWVLNFPTKYHWKYPSKMEYIEKGLQKFVETYKEKKITSIAFPLLGTHNGGLDRVEVKKVIIKYLSQCDIPIEVYDYDPFAPDDLFVHFKEIWQKLNPNEINKSTGIQPQYIRKINEVLENSEVFSMVTLVSFKGIGEKTLQKAFDFAMNYK
ncbi:MAG: macro domain-containing protein [Bacteroidota bacterium]